MYDHTRMCPTTYLTCPGPDEPVDVWSFILGIIERSAPEILTPRYSGSPTLCRYASVLPRQGVRFGMTLPALDVCRAEHV